MYNRDLAFLRVLDEQMKTHFDKLVDRGKVGITPEAAENLATTISQEIGDAPDATLWNELRSSPALSVKRRLFFFEDYQIWNAKIEPQLRCPNPGSLPPERVRTAHNEFLALIQLYMSFVFAGDALFEVLAKKSPPGSAVRKCTKLIRENPVRALRNAVAHGNWHLTASSSVRFWARKGRDLNEPMCEFEVSASDLSFYLALARCVAWTAYLVVAEHLGEKEGMLDNR